MTGTYILDGHTPIPCDDINKWSKWMGKGKYGIAKRRVANTELADVRVSTVFLAVDHQYKDGPPILFETMIFGGEHDEYQERYSTWDEAEAGHKKACLLAGLTPSETIVKRSTK